MTLLRTDLPPLPSRMGRLPIDDRGYPVPYFVQWIDGKPDFRVMDVEKWNKCVEQSRCWVCGEPLGRFKTFVIGPMCVVNRTTAEPAAHSECAIFSVQGCPFLRLPAAQRRDAGLPSNMFVPGVMIPRNPGVSVLWTTLRFQLMKVTGGYLFQLQDDPVLVQWFTRGRPATREEAQDALATGMPILEKIAQEDGAESLGMLQKLHADALQRLPPETGAPNGI